MSKKQSKRLNATMNQFADQDYWQKLTPQEREWLQKFNREYYNHDFKDNPLDTRPEAYKEATDRENAARRDIWNNSTQSHKHKIQESPEEAIHDLHDLIKLNEHEGEEH